MLKHFSLLSFLFVALVAHAQAADPTKFKKIFYLSDYKGQMSFLQLMDRTIKPALDEIYIENDKKFIPNEKAIATGNGVAVEIYKSAAREKPAAEYWNFHINYKDGKTKVDEMSGRSYAQGTTLELNDASDKDYLKSLYKVVKGSSDWDLEYFYKTIITAIGACDTSPLAKLESPAARNVFSDFFTVYTAEEDRHLMSNLGSFNWDDALFEVTLISALHGGQKTLTKFYERKFTEEAYDQSLMTYKQPLKRLANFTGTTRKATLYDYWQFGTSLSPAGRPRSGINVTRKDFEKMAQSITKYAQSVGDEDVQEIINLTDGRGRNIFQDIAKFYINKKALEDGHPALERTKKLSEKVSKFLVKIRAQAQEVTDYTYANE